MARVLTGGVRVPFDPTAARMAHRVCTIYATSAVPTTGLGVEGDRPSQHLRLGRLQRFYDSCVEQLPRVLAVSDLDVAELGFNRWVPRTEPSAEATAREVVRARVWLFRVPAAAVIVVVSLDATGPVRSLIPLLEDCYYAEVTYRGQPLAEHAFDLLRAEDLSLIETDGLRLDSMTHQLVVPGAVGGDSAAARRPRVTSDDVQRLIYRADLDYVEEFSAICYPAELNRRPGSTAAVGPFVSILANQQDYIENCALLSAVQLVAASARVRTLRGEAYQSVRQVRETSAERSALMRAGERNRVGALLQSLSERLAEYEIELTFGVESVQRIGLLVPALRVESYHRELATAMGIGEDAAAVSSMLGRLGTALDAEADALDAYDARRDEMRRLRWAVAIGLLSTAAVPPGILLGFFGVGTSDVDQSTSMFAFRTYAGVYLFLLVVCVLTYGAFVGLWLVQRRQLRRLTPRRRAR